MEITVNQSLNDNGNNAASENTHNKNVHNYYLEMITNAIKQYTKNLDCYYAYNNSNDDEACQGEIKNYLHCHVF